MVGVAGCFEWYVSDFYVWIVGKSGGVVWTVVRLWMCRLYVKEGEGVRGGEDEVLMVVVGGCW